MEANVRMFDEHTLTPRNLAKRVGVSTPTVLRWIKEEGLPAIRVTKRTIRVNPRAVEQWLSERSA